MDGGFPESQGAEGDNSAEDKRGFRGTSENAKTKICMRSARLNSPGLQILISDPKKLGSAKFPVQVAGGSLSIW